MRGVLHYRSLRCIAICSQDNEHKASGLTLTQFLGNLEIDRNVEELIFPDEFILLDFDRRHRSWTMGPGMCQIF